jgi:hypothetical protein
VVATDLALPGPEGAKVIAVARIGVLDERTVDLQNGREHVVAGTRRTAIERQDPCPRTTSCVGPRTT